MRPDRLECGLGDDSATICDLRIDLLDSTVVVRGELDVATGPQLVGCLTTALAGHPFSLTMELKELTFVDASGLSILLQAKRRAEAQSCRFVLLDPPPLLTRLLEITGLEQAFVVERGVEGTSQWVMG